MTKRVDEDTERDERWMSLALEEAEKAFVEGEVPIGAVAVLHDQLLARDHNRSIQGQDPTAHAEILVLRRAGELVNNYRLNGLELYVTIEPCAMCSGALIWARVDRLVFGAWDEKAGTVVSNRPLLEPGLFNHDVTYCAGVLEESCREIMQRFFQKRR